MLHEDDGSMTSMLCCVQILHQQNVQNRLIAHNQQ